MKGETGITLKEIEFCHKNSGEMERATLPKGCNYSIFPKDPDPNVVSSDSLILITGEQYSLPAGEVEKIKKNSRMG